MEACRPHRLDLDPVSLADQPTTTAAAGLLAWATDELDAAGIPTAVGDAHIIVAHALGVLRSAVADGGMDDADVDEAQLAMIRDFVRRRAEPEPLQHLTGVAFFRDLRLAVGPGVFVPRRETELVAGLAVDALRASGREHPIGVDLGMGAGAIALTMATEVPAATVHGVELYPEAFAWARRNFEAIAPDNAHPVLGDIRDALRSLDGQVDVVAGNPPFTPDGEAPVTPEVRLWDPPTAWIGGADGFEIVRSLSRTALRLLRPGGVLALEHGVSQSARIRALLEDDGWHSITSHRDARGIERAATARR